MCGVARGLCELACARLLARVSLRELVCASCLEGINTLLFFPLVVWLAGWVFCVHADSTYSQCRFMIYVLCCNCCYLFVRLFACVCVRACVFNGEFGVHVCSY